MPENIAYSSNYLIVIKTSQKIVIETTFPVGILPLTNPVIIKLNEITTFVQDKSKLTEVEVGEIKKIFKELVKNGERYDVDEIEFWFENEGTWNEKESRVRITNLSSYVQDKHQQTAHLRMVTDDDCSCGN